MSILEHNIRLLKRHLPSFEKTINPCAEYADIKLLPARNSQSTMKFICDGRELFVHSAYDPEKEARTLAKNVILRYDSIVIVFGIGMLHHINALLERAYPKCRILLIEPDYRVFDCAMRTVDFENIINSGKVILSIAPNEAELSKFLKAEIKSHNFIMTEVMVLSAYTSRYAKEYEAFQRVLQNVKGQRETENITIYNQSSLWLENTIRNIKHIPESFRHWSFSGLFEGKPAVVVSSGPSLDKNVKLLAKLKDKAFIIAAYTSLRTLQKHGIEPDIVISIDRLQGYIDTRGDAFSLPPLTVSLLYISTTDYRLLESAKAEKIFAPTPDDKYILDLYSHLGYEEGKLFVSGSVAISAVDFAATAGCNPIILVGQDLAFTGKQLHSKAVKDNKKYVNQQLESAFLVEDVFGEKVLTDSLMELYRRTLEEYIGYDTNTFGRAYIDATEGGVKIEGTDILSLAETVKRIRAGELPADISRILKSHFADKSNRTFDARYATAFLKDIITMYSKIEENPDVIVFKNPELHQGFSVDDVECLCERISEFMYEQTKLFDNYYQRTLNEFVPWWRNRYTDGSLVIGEKVITHPKLIYFQKCGDIIWRVLLALQGEYKDKILPLIADEISRITEQAK